MNKIRISAILAMLCTTACAANVSVMATRKYVDNATNAVYDATKGYVDTAVKDAGKVQSVNGKTGEVELAASDVGARPLLDLAVYEEQTTVTTNEETGVVTTNTATVATEDALATKSALDGYRDKMDLQVYTKGFPESEETKLYVEVFTNGVPATDGEVDLGDMNDGTVTYMIVGDSSIEFVSGGSFGAFTSIREIIVSDEYTGTSCSRGNVPINPETGAFVADDVGYLFPTDASCHNAVSVSVRGRFVCSADTSLRAVEYRSLLTSESDPHFFTYFGSSSPTYGEDASAIGIGSAAFGYRARAYGTNATAIGYMSYATTNSFGVSYTPDQFYLCSSNTTKRGEVKGATARTLQSYLDERAKTSDLATVATSGDYDDLTNKPAIPTNVSDLTNDAHYVKSEDVSQDLVGGYYSVKTSKVWNASISDYEYRVATVGVNRASIKIGDRELTYYTVDGVNDKIGNLSFSDLGQYDEEFDPYGKVYKLDGTAIVSPTGGGLCGIDLRARYKGQQPLYEDGGTIDAGNITGWDVVATNALKSYGDLWVYEYGTTNLMFSADRNGSLTIYSPTYVRGGVTFDSGVTFRGAMSLENGASLTASKLENKIGNKFLTLDATSIGDDYTDAYLSVLSCKSGKTIITSKLIPDGSDFVTEKTVADYEKDPALSKAAVAIGANAVAESGVAIGNGAYATLGDTYFASNPSGIYFGSKASDSNTTARTLQSYLNERLLVTDMTNKWSAAYQKFEAGVQSVWTNKLRSAIDELDPETATPEDIVIALQSIYARFYTVKYVDNTGDGSVTKKVREGRYAKEPAKPTSSTSTFMGWYASGATNAFDFAGTPITNDVTLTAKWKAN